MASEPGLAVRTRVRADRALDFERWVRDVLASFAERGIDMPDVRWFREWSAAETDSDSVDYLILAPGSDISSLDLEPMLIQAYGPDRADAELAAFEAMLSGPQDGWTLEPLPPFED